MNTEIGNTIISKIAALPWLDKYAGVVKPISVKGTEGTKTKIFPAACNATFEECESRYKDLCPDSSKKSVLFLEDGGARFRGKQGSVTSWESSFDLVCWLNLPKLGHEGCSYSAIAIHGIINALGNTPFNVPNKYQRVLIKPAGIKPKNQNPFSRYTFDESSQQFLIYPFDFFVLELDVEFQIDTRCLTAPPLNTAINCQT